MGATTLMHHQPRILCDSIGYGSDGVPLDLPSTNYDPTWFLCNNFSCSSYTTMMGAARMMYLWLQLLRKDISRGSNKVPSVKPSTKYDRPQLLPSNGNASCSSYVTMMDVAPIIHHRPQQILCKNVGCGSNEMPSDLPSTNYNLPWLLCNNFSYIS